LPSLSLFVLISSCYDPLAFDSDENADVEIPSDFVVISSSERVIDGSSEVVAQCTDEVALEIETSAEILLEVYGEAITDFSKQSLNDKYLDNQVVFVIPSSLTQKILDDNLVDDTNNESRGLLPSKKWYRMEWGPGAGAKPSCHDFRAYTWVDAWSNAFSWGVNHGVNGFSMHQAECNCKKYVCR